MSDSKTQNYPEVVQKIHEEYLTAGETLLNESKAILKQLEEKQVSKAQNLSKLGFTGTPEFKSLSPLLDNVKQAKEDADLVLSYQRKYPAYKFISTEDVKKINKKYGLSIGEISQYKGFVPEKNLKEIDLFLQTAKLPLKRFKLTQMNLFQWINIIPLSKWKFKSEMRKINNIVLAESDWQATKIIDRLCEKISLEGGEGYHSGYISNHGAKFEQLPSLVISAPKKDFTGSLINKITFKYVPDPIVLAQVPNGYLIVTAWGDEAKDPLILNQQMN